MSSVSGVKPLSDFGTSIGVESTNAIGAFPVKNFQQGSIENIKYLTGPYLVEGGFLKRKISCYSCPVACHRFVTVDEGPYRGTYTGGPEYETLSALGGGCYITDTAAIIKGGELCNILGLDTISTGNCIQWLLECKQRGVVTDEDASGLDLSWGNTETMIELIKMIANREGIRDLLAGLEVASEELGKDSYKWAIQARDWNSPGLKPGRHMPMRWPLRLVRGPDHLNTECLAEFGGSPEARQLIKRITGSEEYAYRIQRERARLSGGMRIYMVPATHWGLRIPDHAQFWVDEWDLADLFESFTGIR